MSPYIILDIILAMPTAKTMSAYDEGIGQALGAES